MDEPTFAITLDTDWTPEHGLEMVLDRFFEDLPVTIFATGPYSFLKEGELVEVGIHPNYEQKSLRDAFEPLMSIFPSATGHRAHSLHYTERLRPLFDEYGILYDSAFMHYFQPNVHPCLIGREVMELPQYFMDMFHMEMCRGKGPAETWDIDRVDFEAPGLRIFNFHPVHLLLNTGTEQDYLANKRHYQEPAQLVDAANQGEGTATFLTALVQRLKLKGIQPYLLREIARGASPLSRRAPGSP